MSTGQKGHVNRRDMCRMRQGIRESTLPFVTYPRISSSVSLKELRRDREISSDGNLIECIVQDPSPQPRRSKKKPSKKSLETMLANQVQRLKQFYDERVIQLTRRCTEAETKLRVTMSDLEEADKRMRHMHELVESQHARIEAADKEFNSLLSWCRERETNWKQHEANLAIWEGLHQELVQQVQGLDEARNSIQELWMGQEASCARIKQESEDLIAQLVQTESMLRDQLNIKNSSLAEAVAQRDSHEEEIRTLKKLNQDLNGALTEIKHYSTKLESQLEIETASKMEWMSELQALTEQLMSERREHDTMTMHVHCLSQRQSGTIHERDVKCEELSLECRRIAYELQAATARYENAEATINSMQLKVEDYKKENRNLSTNIDQLETLLRDERAVVEAKDTILAQAKMELAALRHKAALAEDKTIEAIKEANKLKRRITLLRHDPTLRFEAPVVAPLSMAS